MIVTKSSGCAGDGIIKVNNILLNDYSSSELYNIVFTLFQNIKDMTNNEDTLIDIIDVIVSDYGEVSEIGHCDRCYDNCFTYIYEHNLKLDD